MLDPQAPSSLHTVLETKIAAPPQPGQEEAIFALGCFWGAERAFWKLEGVITTAVGYIAGQTEGPSYREVCSGTTGHTEAVRVVYDPAKISYQQLLRSFFESHNPTQGNRQGNDIGTQYRSGIYTTTPEQLKLAESARDEYQKALTKAGRPSITTEIQAATTFWYAEDYHQQYLDKNPGGYCGLGGCGVKFPA